MRIKTLFLTGIAPVVALAAAVPAQAELVRFELTGGKTASFVIDTSVTPSFSSQTVFGDQVSYNGISGIFGGTPGTGSIGFGTSIFAQLNIGGTALGFTQYAGATDLFSFVNSQPVFKTGTFALSSITSGPAQITISSAATAVPEPAAWAMLIVGFGAVGMTLRARRPSRVAAIA